MIVNVSQSKVVRFVDHVNELFLSQLFLKRTVFSTFLFLHSPLFFLQSFNLLNLQTFIHIITRQKANLHSQLSNDKNETLFLQNFKLKFHHFIRQYLYFNKVKFNDLNDFIDIHDLQLKLDHLML